MANDVKWSDWRSSEIDGVQPAAAGTNPRAAFLQLLGCVVGLAVLAVVLPGPASWLDELSGVPSVSDELVSVGGTADTAILVTASVLVWLLLAWVLAVWIAAVAARLPGAPGRYGRAMLRRIAPAMAGRIVAAAVGVSLLAGTSACAVPAMGDPGSSTSAGVVAGESTTSTPAPLGGAAGVVDPATGSSAATPTAGNPAALEEVLASITIDWPAAASTQTAPPETVPTETAPPEAVPTETTPAETTSTEATASAPPEAVPTETSPADAATGTNEVAQLSPAGDETSFTSGTPIDPAAGQAAAPARPSQERAVPNADSPGRIVVHSGDTLWSIAHHHLTPDATDQEIDTAWRAWYSVNAQTIGDDPNLIQPGQLLLPPDPEMER